MADLAPMNRHRPKFTLDELELLVNQMQRNKSTLLCKFSDVQAAQTKNDAWPAISAMIIGVAKLGSPTDEMRRKWLDQGKRRKTKGVFSPEVDENNRLRKRRYRCCVARRGKGHCSPVVAYVRGHCSPWIDRVRGHCRLWVDHVLGHCRCC